MKWGAGDVGDGALVTAQIVVSNAGWRWADIPPANRVALVDAVLAGAAHEWTALLSDRGAPLLPNPARRSSDGH